MVYVYYNLRLSVKQLERIRDMEAISLDGIDTTAAWRVEFADDWLEQEVLEGVEGEEEEEVTRPTQATPATSRGRGLPPIAPSSSVSRAQQSTANSTGIYIERERESYCIFSQEGQRKSIILVIWFISLYMTL